MLLDYDGSTKNNGCPNSTGEESSTRILTIFPDTSDSISLKSFIASMTQSTSPSAIVCPTSTNNGLSGYTTRCTLSAQTFDITPEVFSASIPVIFMNSGMLDIFTV